MPRSQRIRRGRVIRRSTGPSKRKLGVVSEITRRRSTRLLVSLAALGALLAPAPAPARADDTSPRIAHDVSTALFAVALDVRVAGRRFVYTDALSPNLRDYHLRAV